MSSAKEKAHATATEIERAHADGEAFRQLDANVRPATIIDAYAAQNELQHLRAGGKRGTVAGRKIALASKVQQELCGIDHPIAGAIYSNEIHSSPCSIKLSDYHGLGIEFEIAITLKTDTEVSREYSRDEISQLINTVHPAFEMIIDRGADYQNIDPITMIADNAWCAGIVLGDDFYTQCAGNFDDLPATLRWNDDVETASTAASDPITSLTWVINLLASMGQTLQAGQPVITGSVMKTRYPTEGDHVSFQVEGSRSIELNIN